MFGEIKKGPARAPDLDSAQCPECFWKGRLIYCESELDSDGWEYPTYTVHLCPRCGEYVGDYYYSREGIRDYITWKKTHDKNHPDR